MALPAAGGILRVSDLYAGPTTYVPTLTASTTSPTLGTGSTATGWYHRMGQLITVGFIIRFGTSGAAAGSGNYRVSLPVAASGTYMTTGGGSGITSTVGTAILRDDGTTSSTASAWLFNSTTLQFVDDGGAVVTNSSPWTWAANDGISGIVSYIAAS